MIVRRRRAAATTLAVTAVVGLTLTGVPSGAAAPSDDGRDAATASPVSKQQRERKGFYDARAGTTKTEFQNAREVVAERGKTFKTFARNLGPQAVLDFDPATGTPRNVARLDGFLTGASSRPARAIALGYVRAHLTALGLQSSDLSTLHLLKQYVDVAGIHHLSWTQSVNGVQVFGNGLEAHVTKTGRLISLQGSPISGLVAMARHADASPSLSATAARSRAATDVGGKAGDVRRTASTGGATKWANHDQAKLVYFASADGLRLGWSTYVQAGGDNLSYQHVIDAKTGAVLYRRDTVQNDRGDAYVYENYPGAPDGGKAHVVNLIEKGYLAKAAGDLTGGKYVAAWSDINDDNEVNKGETVPVPGAKNGTPQYKLVPFEDANEFCSASFVCTWDNDEPGSWFTNKRADVTQGFYFNSIYHDYLKAAPFGFTPQAGNFELAGNDPVLLNSLDGANTDHGLPDADHSDNANMNTPPDGIPPTMQMYLFGDFFPLETSSSFDASILLHEYTHGLSNRLVTDAQGNSTLNSIQAGSMGEAWSDYYAMDYLVTKGLEPDTKASGEVLAAAYVMADQGPFRTMAIDCAVKATAENCFRPFDEGHGGYTYGDFPFVGGAPEVHSSGEVWAQTLWDLRKRLGHDVTAMLVTRAMELSADDPSFLDMRNAIVQADLAVYGGAHRTDIWRVFAHRGMGWYAGALDGGDAHPVEDKHMPPAPTTPRVTVSGQVTDPVTDQPVPNALVSITGHDSGTTGDYTAVTDASGRYSIADVYIGTYPVVSVFAPGYEILTQEVVVERGGTTADFSPRRDWAAASGGGEVTDFNGPDYTPFGCGPGGAIDLSMGTGWGSTTGNDNGDDTNVMIPKFIEVKLPASVTVQGFAVNPSNTCGDPGSSSTGDYRIETSPDGVTWTTAKEGTFTSADRHLVDVAVAAPIPGVQYVKFWMLSPQVPDFATNCPEGAFGGCQFTDMTELEVFGAETTVN